MRRRFLILLGVATLGCTADVREGITFGEPPTSASGETATSGPAESTGSTSSTTGGSTATSEEATSSTSGETTDASTSSGSTEAGSSSEESSGSAPVCGNEIVEGSEECDDGNSSDLDECTTECVIPVCDDGLRNGSESDIDCGGTCLPCLACLACEIDADCETGLCNADNRCGFEGRIEIDSEQNCNSSPSPNVDSARLENVPPGNYIATSVDSAWNAYSEANPPDTGWTYYTPCTGIDLQQMQTPDGVRYSDPATAYANIMATSEAFTSAGGTIACSRVDGNCGDNQGSVIFDIALVCD